jgi:predicted HicB family RNase H-like nuclease|tara:strand:+ start:1535 stop:1876 length:342 start_codon:yes stop_codon:yes gene_type:complete
MTVYLEYAGYQGTIEPQLESGTLYGKLAFIRDLVTFEADNLKALEAEFRVSVDDYLADCIELDKAPDKPFKGVFNVRTGPDLHRAAVIASGSQSLNAFVCTAIQEKVERLEAS